MITQKQRQMLKKSVWRFVKIRIIHVDDSAQRIALGVGVGLFVAYMPPLGFHIFLALGLAWVLRANKFTAVASVWFCNPLTFLMIYYPSYVVGNSLAGWFGAGETGGTEEGVKELFMASLSVTNFMTGFYRAEFWRELAAMFGRVGLEMTLGGVVLGSIVGTMGYVLTYWFVSKHRRHNPHRRFRERDAI